MNNHPGEIRSSAAREAFGIYYLNPLGFDMLDLKEKYITENINQKWVYIHIISGLKWV
jgi:hypothetical protein